MSASQTPAKVARLRLDRGNRVEESGPESARESQSWRELRALPRDADTMRRHRLFVDNSDDDITRRFDLLRTLLSDTIEEHGITRLGVTAPTAGSGTSFVAANLALAMARRPSARVLLADMNLRRPALARMFGATAPTPVADLLTGQNAADQHLRLFGSNLALLLNSQTVGSSAEMLHDPAAAEALREMRQRFDATLEIYDLPPVLGRDDVLSFLPQLDGVLMVVDGTRNTAAQLRAAEELLTGRTRLVAVVLNRGEIRRSLYEIIQSIRSRFQRGRNKE
ncbi:CpsD/CapB family tyrosine-protein kinase [Paracoccus sp. EGI L200073]|nr:CpsD/CapB family tyrosine-protein kinase [Paracoccus salsus]